MTPNELFKTHATTFFSAAKLFAPEDRSNITHLYAFCRTVDNLADEDDNPERFKEIQQRIQKNDFSDFPQFAALIEERKIPPYYPQLLVEAISEDLTPRQLTSEESLIDYCMGVGSTVGLMICKIVSLKNPEAVSRAIDLGIAMQLTNIARDVWEDAVRGFIYLPETFFSANFFTSSMDLSDKCNKVLHHYTEECFGIRKRMVQLADHFYRSAEIGYHSLDLRSSEYRFLPTRSLLDLQSDYQLL